MPLPNARTQSSPGFSNSIATIDPTRHHICIIGGGAAGAQFYKESVRRTMDTGLADIVSYTIVDPRPYEELGQGIAWSLAQSDLLLANMRINTIGFSPDIVDMISEVVSIGSADNLSDVELFRKRKEIGRFLHQDFNNKKNDADQKEIQFLHVRAACIAIYEYGTGYLVETDTGVRHFAHDIVLALGNSLPSSYHELRGHPNYLANPWSWQEYGKINKSYHVGVIGLGPTAIDTILLLNQYGINRITSYSRDGMIQAPRPRSNPYNPKFMRAEYIAELYKEFGLTFSQVRQLIHHEFEHAGVPCSDLREALKNAKSRNALTTLHDGLAHCEEDSKWFAVLKSFDDVTPLIWSLLPESDKDKYLSEWRKQHMVVSYGMASVQARRISELLFERVLTIQSGVTAVDPEGNRFVVSYKQNNSMKKDNVDYVVNCSGIGTNILVSENPLVRFLVENKFLVSHPRGGAYVDFDSGQILNDERLPQGQVYSLVGSLTYGTHLLTHCLGEVMKSATRTAQAIHRGLNARYQKQSKD